mmetsp:Transcript_64098/g.114356  ORF Transcript_64098/g.114356 Transcript_64098/m.114356 type:complete len:93 (+) Transcript_64098:359-637(+)
MMIVCAGSAKRSGDEFLFGERLADWGEQTVVAEDTRLVGDSAGCSQDETCSATVVVGDTGESPCRFFGVSSKTEGLRAQQLWHIDLRSQLSS